MWGWGFVWGIKMPMEAIPEDFPIPKLSRVGDNNRYGGPIIPYFFFPEEGGPFKRVVLRVSWKTPACFTIMPLICDTCAPGGIYLCKSAMKQMLDEKQIVCNSDGVMTTSIFCEDGAIPMVVLPTPTRHEPFNLMGLFALQRLGMRFDCDHIRSGGISFTKNIKWFGELGPPVPPVSPVPSDIQALWNMLKTTNIALEKLEQQVKFLVEERLETQSRLRGLDGGGVRHD